MRTARSAFAVAALTLALAGVTACTSSGGGDTSPPSTPTSNVPPTAPAPTLVTAPSSTTTSASLTSSTPVKPSTPVQPPSPTSAPSTSSTYRPPPTRSSTPPAPVTHRVVVRPVRPDGTPAPGYTVHNSPDTAQCLGSDPSPVAVDGATLYCGPSALFAIACWKSDAHHVLCLDDPAKRTLTRIAVTGTFAGRPAPRTPAPMVVSLDNGLRCTIRDGGAAGSLERYPKLFVYYYCRQGSTLLALWGPRGGIGVDTSAPMWTVELGPQGGAGYLVTRKVITATFVGTLTG